MSSDEMLESGSRCGMWHPLWLVSEGYALCYRESYRSGKEGWFAWALTRPVSAGWAGSHIRGRDDEAIEAWVSLTEYANKDGALDLIQLDMNAHRALPFVEEVERSRLVMVPR